MVVLGFLLGLCAFNVATLFSTPVEIDGMVSQVVEGEQLRRRGRFWSVLVIDVSTQVGDFYVLEEPYNFPPEQEEALRNGQGMSVTVAYSELTGSLIAIEDLGRDRRTGGQIFWPLVAAGVTLVALSKIYFDWLQYRDATLTVGLLLLYFAAGPSIGILAYDTVAVAVRRVTNLGLGSFPWWP